MTYKLIDAAHTRWRAVNVAAPGRCRPCRRRVPQGKAAERPVDITPAQPDQSTETEVA